MAARDLFQDLETVFKEPKVEWESPPPAAAAAAASADRRFYVHFRSPDANRLEVVASDFRSETWGRIFTVPQLEDLKANSGICGSCSDFVDYLVSSVSYGDVKLILSALPKLKGNSGILQAKLVVRKSEGMPHISLSLHRLLGSSANDAICNFSVALYKAYEQKRYNVVKEQGYSLQLAGLLVSEREKNGSLKQQLDDLKASQKTPLVSNTSSSCTTNSFFVVQQSSAKNTSDIEIQSTKDPLYASKSCQSDSLVYSRVKSRRVFLPNAGNE